jgi:luciferase family oxidoreductase group 1
MSIQLSILDRTPSNPEETTTQSLMSTINFAKAADKLGYKRFWVSEHHGSSTLLGSSPEVLMSYLLANTETIRIGSGGVMLQHYSAYKVAENFNLLASLAPGRVDVGIGRAPGGVPASTQALQGAISQDQGSLEDKLSQLGAFIRTTPQPAQDGYQLLAQPVPQIAPDIYLLGSNTASAELAARQGLGYVFASFISGDEAVAQRAVEVYRRTFDGATGRKPDAIIAVAVLIANTEAEAQAEASEIKTYKVRFDDGKTLTLNTQAAAELLSKQADKPNRIEVSNAAIVFGSRETIADKLIEIAHRYSVGELMLLPAQHTYAQRINIIETVSASLLAASSESISESIPTTESTTEAVY